MTETATTPTLGKDRPIIFSAPMVRALLDGRKTQTRRIISAEIPDGHFVEHCHFCASGWGLWERGPWAGGGRCTCREVKGIRFRDGDRLYVRERGWISPSKQAFQPFVDNELGPTPQTPAGVSWKPSPSIHMPRWASRLTLTVTDVRVERLNDISEADAWAEGCKKGEADDAGGFFPAEEPDPSGIGLRGWDNARDWFADLWEEINGDDAWDANPWVVAVTFTVHHANIDALQPAPVGAGRS
jgi:hypothetical protein